MEDGEYLSFIDFKNKGGLLTPLPLTITFADGKKQDMMIPAEIWRYNGDAVTKKGYVGIHSTGFRDFLLKPELLRAIVDCGFEHPSEGTCDGCERVKGCARTRRDCE